MAGRFEPVAGLDAIVARMVEPEISRTAEKVAKAAAAHAPPVKIWQTQGDLTVRPWHRSQNHVAIPGNLRFKLEHSPRTYRQYHPAGHELLRFPRDPSAYYLQTQDCRCFLKYNADLATSIKADRAVVSGARVTADVHTEYPRAAESEFGTPDDPPARFMGRGVSDVAATL